MDLADHGEKGGGSRAFLQRPQAILDPAGRDEKNARRVEAEGGKPVGERQARLAGDLWVDDPQKIAVMPFGKLRGQGRGKTRKRARLPGFGRRDLVQRPAGKAGGGEQPVEPLHARAKTGRPLPGRGVGRGRRKLRLGDEASLHGRNAVAQLGKTRPFRESVFHGSHDCVCSCYVLIDSANRARSQAVIFAGRTKGRCERAAR